MATAAVLITLVAPVALSACSSDDSTVSSSADRLHRDLSAEMRPLVDSDGLVRNPVTETAQPLDIYSSALISDTVNELKLAPMPAKLQNLSKSDIEAFTSSGGIPADWVETSLAILDRYAGGTLREPLGALPPASDAGADSETIATGLWMRAQVDRAIGNRPDEPTVVSEARSLLSNKPLTIAAGWRATSACQLLGATCSIPAETSFSIDIDLSSAEKIFLIRGAAELRSQGVQIRGWNSATVRQLARQSLDGIAVGDPVVATSLAAIIYRTGGGTSNFTDYLRREAKLLDHGTGLYRVYSQQVGTIANTYEAYRILGDQFGSLVAGRPTEATLERMLASDSTLDPVSKLQAIAIVHDLSHGRTSSASRTFSASTSSSIAGRTFSGPGAVLALYEIDALRDLGRTPKAVTIDPVPVSAQNEAEVDMLIAQAGDGVLANSAQVLAYYRSYLHGLPKVMRGAGADNALLMARLSVVLVGSQQLSAGDESVLQSLAHSRIGCAKYPHLVRVSVNPAQGCDLSETKLMLSSPIGLAAEGAS